MKNLFQPWQLPSHLYKASTAQSVSALRSLIIIPTAATYGHHTTSLLRFCLPLFQSPPLRTIAQNPRITQPASFSTMASKQASKLVPKDPEEVMVIRKVTPNITTLSVPFSRFGRIRIGGRATIGKLSHTSQSL